MAREDVTNRVNGNGIQPVIPFIFLYDSGGGQTFDSSGEYHTWDSVEFKTSHFTYSADDDRISLEVNSYGIYAIEFDCSFFTTYNGNVMVTTEIEKNGTTIDGSESVISVSGTGSPELRNSQSIHYVLRLNKGDIIKIKTTTDVDSVDTVIDTSRLIIYFIPVYGFNNSNGGRMEFKGGIIR